jgi:hypothetical protein
MSVIKTILFIAFSPVIISAVLLWGIACYLIGDMD